jgi:hypothetical protein
LIYEGDKEKKQIENLSQNLSHRLNKDGRPAKINTQKAKSIYFSRFMKRL